MPSQPDELHDAHMSEAARAAADAIRQIQEETHGVGANDASAVFIGQSTLVVFLDGLELLPNEEFLVSQGEAEAVMEARTRYQEAVSHRFIAAVERATGRRVRSFSSVTNLDDARFAAEIFSLAPEAR